MRPTSPCKNSVRNRRIMSVWFPRLAVERALLEKNNHVEAPAVAVAEVSNSRILVSLTASAEKQGLHVGMSLHDALAIFPTLITCTSNAIADTKFLIRLRLFADKYSPFVADDSYSGLVADVTGCAHLFGGEECLLDHVEQDYCSLGLTTRTGMADTLGAAWALARYARFIPERRHTSDDIDQEARATRSRSNKRWRWPKTRPAQRTSISHAGVSRLSPPGGTKDSLSPLPLAALRLPRTTVEEMARLGFRSIGHLLKLRGDQITQRFGSKTAERIDQALGIRFEPVSAARREPRFAVRLSLPEPVGLQDDILAGLDRLLSELCNRLKSTGYTARRALFELRRADGGYNIVQAELAKPDNSPGRFQPLLAMKLDTVDVGEGIDALRLEATLTEPVLDGRPNDILEMAEANINATGADVTLDDLISRLGARVGMEAITRFHPADSHIPEKSAAVMSAAWSKPELNWKEPSNIRPAFLFKPEFVLAPDTPLPPKEFRWQRNFVPASTVGPERLMPEWWLDDPNWRSGTRDYWRVVTKCGRRLWMFYAHGTEFASKGWFCHGDFD